MAALPIHIAARGETDVGQKRDHNEDSFVVDEDLGLFVVADGMGGHAGGGTASRLAVESIQARMWKARAAQPDLFKKLATLEESPLREVLRDAVEGACRDIFRAAQGDPALAGMGTTVTAVAMAGPNTFVAHVGDSRCYRIRAGQINQITRDHSLLEDYKEAKPDMTEEEERNFPHKNVITRALGMRDTVQVDIKPHQIFDGDIYLMCSDGLSGMVEDGSILRIVTQAKSLERAVAELVDTANRAGGTDNITTLVLQCVAA